MWFEHYLLFLWHYSFPCANLCFSTASPGLTSTSTNPDTFRNCFLMDSNNRNSNSKILFWNIRGVNSQQKWDAIREKINESACHIIYLQETKREYFDNFYIKNFCPRNLDIFAFAPSIGASRGLLTVWNSGMFDGSIVQACAYGLTVKFTCRADNSCFFVTNIYGPSHSELKDAFITWLMNLDTSTFDNWVLGGDFNLYRSPADKNKPGGDVGEMDMFNNLIADLDLVEIPFSGRNFTWSNMQSDPLLVKLDWVFTGAEWPLSFPATSGKDNL